MAHVPTKPAFKRQNPTLPEGADGKIYERMMADLRGHLFAYGTWEKLAQDANLSVTTVVKFAHGTTRAPHFSTVFKLLAALGRLNELAAALHCNNPVSVAEAARRKKAGA